MLLIGLLNDQSMEGKYSSWKRIEGFDIWRKQSLPSKNLSRLKGPIYFLSETFSPVSPRYQGVIQNTVLIQQSTSMSRLLFSFPLNQSFCFQTFLEDRSKSELSGVKCIVCVTVRGSMFLQDLP